MVTDVTDAGVYALATTCAQSKLRSLDVSFCASLSDDGVSAVAERCAALEYLNLSGLHRVTDAAAVRVTHNLWRLRTLCLEDLHLITDAIFFFDAKKDGRAAARQQMWVGGVLFVPSSCRNLWSTSMAWSRRWRLHETAAPHDHTPSPS